MSSNINRVFITGNLTRDPDLRATRTGLAVADFGVAVNESRKNAQTGEWDEYANFIDVSAFGSQAETFAKYLSKGDKVSIEGKLRWSQWEKDGQKRSKLSVIAERLEFMSKRGTSDQNGGYVQQDPSAYVPSADQGQQYAAASVYDEDIPF